MTKGWEEQGTNQRILKILLVEDNEANIKIALRAFAKIKLRSQINVVKSGQDALDYIHHKGQFQNKEHFPRPELILLDIQLPKLDGFEVLKLLKENQNFASIPVIMFTTSKNEEDVMRSYKNGAAGYIHKPVDYEELVKVIDGFVFYWHTVNMLPNSDLCKK